MNAKNIISIASRSDCSLRSPTPSAYGEDIFAFLDKQGLAENAWLIGSVFAAIQRDEVWETVYIYRRRNQIVGVAYMLNQRKVPVGDRVPGFDPGYDYEVQMDAEDASAVEAMIAAFPSDQTELILQDGHVPLCCGYGRTETDTAASQALAQGLGYWQIARRMTYLWRKV